MNQELKNQIADLDRSMEEQISILKRFNVLQKRRQTFISGGEELDRILSTQYERYNQLNADRIKMYQSVIDDIVKYAEENRKKPIAIKEYRELIKKQETIRRLD